MNSPTPAKSKPLLSLISWACAAIIVLMPFHAFLTVWGASLVGHYTLLRLWKEALLIVVLAGCLAVWLKERAGSPALLPRQPVVVLTVAYIALLGLSGGLALASGAVTAKALAYGLLIDVRFLVFFLVAWLVCRHDRRILSNWHHLLLVPAAVVVVFGLLQCTLLPSNFLTHFGYGPDTIAATQTVDQKAGYQRVQSTLRGANPLGAYLVIIIATAGAFFIRKPHFHRWRAGLLLLGAGLTLIVTFSRSAWLGALAAAGCLLLQTIRSARARQLLLVAGAAGLLVLGAAGYSLRNNDLFQNTFLHTDEHSRSAASSNQGHLNATKNGLADIVRSPLGSGTGTAGPASLYNGSHPARIAENYFVQIGQEAGIIGFGLFVAINLVVGRQLLLRRQHLMARVLLASLVGLSVVNLLSHAWADDTLGYIWWGLAGAAMTLPVSHKAAGRSAAGSRVQPAGHHSPEPHEA